MGECAVTRDKARFFRVIITAMALGARTGVAEQRDTVGDARERRRPVPRRSIALCPLDNGKATSSQKPPAITDVAWCCSALELEGALQIRADSLHADPRRPRDSRPVANLGRMNCELGWHQDSDSCISPLQTSSRSSVALGTKKQIWYPSF